MPAAGSKPVEMIRGEEILSTTQEAMRFLRVSRVTIDRMIMRGNLKAH